MCIRDRSIDPQMLNYAESFGLVIFVYALGLQVGPGFFSSFRKGGDVYKRQIGVGATKRLSAVRWGVTKSLMTAWVLTIPVSALLAAGIYWVYSYIDNCNFGFPSSLILA